MQVRITENEICKQCSDAELSRPKKNTKDDVLILKIPKNLSKNPVISCTADRLHRDLRSPRGRTNDHYHSVSSLDPPPMRSQHE